MQRGNFNLKWVQFFAYFCVVFFCVTTLPKVGRTNHAVDADATASAQKTGQNSFWATFKGKQRQRCTLRLSISVAKTEN